MTTVDVPTAVHIGADELPFVDIGDGSKLKVLQVKEAEGLWIVENVFQADYEVQRHKHTGPVYAYTTSGAWKYKEYDYVNRAGSFLYEPAGSVHTLQAIEDDTHVWFQMYGANLNLDADGNVESVVDGALTLYVERGGKTLLSWTEDEHVLKEAATALSSAVSAGALGRMVVQKADGASVHESTPLSAALQAAGFAATPRGLRLRA